MIPRFAALSSAAVILANSDFASSSFPAATAARTLFCPDLSALITLELRARRVTPWRARLAADLMFAME
jgi:hypothetical protein